MLGVEHRGEGGGAGDVEPHVERELEGHLLAERLRAGGLRDRQVEAGAHEPTPPGDPGALGAQGAPVEAEIVDPLLDG